MVLKCPSKDNEENKKPSRRPFDGEPHVWRDRHLSDGHIRLCLTFSGGDSLFHPSSQGSLDDTGSTRSDYEP